MTKTEFLNCVENFLQKSNLSATALGLLAKADPKFVSNLRNGTESREATQEKVLAYMRRYAAENNIDWKAEKNV